MKQILISIIAIAFITSCDKGYKAINYIENKTDILIICDYYRADTINESYRIEANSKVEIYNGSDIGSPGYDIINLDAEYIRIEGYRDTVIVLYPYEETSFKSLFDKDNWVKTLEDEDVYISTYIFE